MIEAYKPLNSDLDLNLPEELYALRMIVAYCMSDRRFYEDAGRMALIKNHLYENGIIYHEDEDPVAPHWNDLGPKTKFVMCSLIDAAMNKDGSIKKQIPFLPVDIIEHVRRVMQRNPYNSFDILFR